MKIFKHAWMMAAALATATLMNSCMDDEQLATPQTPTPPPAPTYTIEGQWLQDESSDETQLWVTEDFKADGTYSAQLAMVDQTTSLLVDYDGSYTLADDNLTLRYTNPIDGNTTTEDYQIQELGQYGMKLFHTQIQNTAVFARVVDTWQMKVGDTRTVSITDFSANAYTSTNSLVAAADAQGQVKAIHRGFAFIKASNADATAVIRVEVTDPQRPIDDFITLLGASTDQVKAIYGTNYLEVPGNPLTEWRFNLVDELIETIVFTHAKDQILATTVLLREQADTDAITEYLSSLYTVTYDEKGVKMYSAEKDGQKYLISWNILKRTITYIKDSSNPNPEPTPSEDADYTKYDGLILLTIEEAAEQLGYELTDENWEDGWTDDIAITDNNIFESLSLIFEEEDEPHEVGTVTLRCKRNVKQEDIEGWYRDHYEATGDALNPYYRDGDKHYWVSFKQSGSRLEVLYKTSKRKK